MLGNQIKRTWNLEKDEIRFKILNHHLHVDTTGRLSNLQFECYGYSDSQLCFSGSISFGNEIERKIINNHLDLNLSGSKIVNFINEFEKYSGKSKNGEKIYYQTGLTFSTETIDRPVHDDIFELAIHGHFSGVITKSFNVRIDLRCGELIISGFYIGEFYELLTYNYSLTIQYQLYLSPDINQALLIGISIVCQGNAPGNLEIIEIDNFQKHNLSETIIETNKKLLQMFYIEPKELDDELLLREKIDFKNRESGLIVKKQIKKFGKKYFAGARAFSEYGYFCLWIKDEYLHIYRMIQYKKGLIMKTGDGTEKIISLSDNNSAINSQIHEYIESRWRRMYDNGKAKNSLVYI